MTFPAFRKANYINILISSFAFLLSASLFGQDKDQIDEGYEFHPLLSDKFTITLGAYKSTNAYKASAGASAERTPRDIDFDESLGVDDNTVILNGNLHWRFGQKWSLSGQYFATDTNGEATLLEDVEWQGNTFLEGTFVAAGIDTRVARLFLGRTFSSSAQHEFGLGLGIHNLDLRVFIEGEAILEDGGGTGFIRSDASKSQPLPNIGAWYLYSPARNWLFNARLDFFSANIGAYDGTLINGNLGVNYQFSRHFGASLAYQYFEIDLTVDKSDWNGGIKLTYSGPILSLSANW